jgi:glycosyl transferase family 1
MWRRWRRPSDCIVLGRLPTACSVTNRCTWKKIAPRLLPRSPIDWPEPFGLVVIEAMACGTPVIAWRCGSVSEIVEDGKTGFIVDTEDDAVRAVLKLDQIDRRTVRRVFQERFTAEVMARNYLRLYWRLCAAAGTADGRHNLGIVH